MVKRDAEALRPFIAGDAVYQNCGMEGTYGGGRHRRQPRRAVRHVPGLLRPGRAQRSRRGREGREAYRADVGISGDRIAQIGQISERAARTIDADGHAVTPGFIDGHTHLDAQVNWDPLGTSSCWHGVTSVVMGNCGFTLAPAREAERALLVRHLERPHPDHEWEARPERRALDLILTLAHVILAVEVQGDQEASHAISAAQVSITRTPEDF